MKLSSRLVAMILLAGFATALTSHAQERKTGKISWKKITLDRKFRSEGVGVADVNKDGKPDVIVGDCWYEAPKEPGGEWKRHILRADRAWDLGGYTQSFCCFTDDFNGDGWADVIVIPFPGAPCYWYENPGVKGGKWKEHLLATSACNETPIYVDLFKTGKKTLVMGWNPPKEDGKGTYDDRGEMCYFVPGKDPTQPWQRISVSGPWAKDKGIPGTARFSHGLGHGDVNGDGRVDIIVPQGWWEQPAKVDGTPWKFHPANISEACADMFTYDMTGTGKADIISTSAHNYGFWWSEQKDGNTFVRRSLFQPPSVVAKMPEKLKLSKEQKRVFETVNSVRAKEFKAPLALDGELCELAQRFAGKFEGGLEVELGMGEIRKAYSGKIISGATANEFDNVIGNFLSSEKHHRPHCELGIGVFDGRPKGKMFYVLLVGDRAKFSLPSQTHALHMVDIDGDGLKDFVTGRRFWAHGPRGDAGPNDPAYLYWFQARRGKDGLVTFTPHVIDDDSGIGTGFAIADMNGDGFPDVIVSNKKGVHVFLQQR